MIKLDDPRIFLINLNKHGIPLRNPHPLIFKIFKTPLVFSGLKKEVSPPFKRGERKLCCEGIFLCIFKVSHCEDEKAKLSIEGE